MTEATPKDKSFLYCFREKKSHHFHPDILETVIGYHIAGTLQFLGSFRVSDSRWIPSSGGYWYCKPGPTVSNSSLSLVIQPFPAITVVSQYKLRAAKEEYKCVNTSELSWISWVFPFSRVKFICNNLVLFKPFWGQRDWGADGPNCSEVEIEPELVVEVVFYYFADISWEQAHSYLNSWGLDKVSKMTFEKMVSKSFLTGE